MRGFLVFVLLCLVVFVGAGFYLGWFAAGTTTDPDTDKRRVELTIDQDKMRRDFRKATGAVSDALKKPSEEKRDFAAARAEGILQQVDEGARRATVNTRDGALILKLEDATQVRLVNGPGAVRDLRPGMNVEVHYETHGSEHHARSIIVLPGG